YLSPFARASSLSGSPVKSARSDPGPRSKKSSYIRVRHEPVRSICADAGPLTSMSRPTKSARCLEGILDGKLHDARIPTGRGDLSKRADIVVGRRVAPVEVVEQVEGLDPELEVLCRPERHQPRNREI